MISKRFAMLVAVLHLVALFALQASAQESRITFPEAVGYSGNPAATIKTTSLP